MKILATTLAALMLMISAALQAQSDTTKVGNVNKPDTTNISLGDKKILLIDPNPDHGHDDNDSTDVAWTDDDNTSDKDELTHWGGIDLGINMLIGKDGTTTLDSADQWLEQDYARSMSWRFNVYEEKIRIYKDYIGIITGLGLTYNSYGLKRNVDVLTNDSTGNTYGQLVSDTIRDYSKNKLRATYLNVPLILEVNTSEDNNKCFHIAAGVIGGWKIGSLTRQKWEHGDERYMMRTKADYNLTPFTLDATARIGYKNFTVFGTYGLTPLFKKDKGPEVYPVTIGIQIVPF